MWDGMPMDRPTPPSPDPTGPGDPVSLLRARSSAGRWVVAATVLGSGMAAIDATVIGIALPAIGRDLHAPLGTLQWVVTGYTLTLASLLLLGGSLGDRFGRRRVFLVGVAWFALASAACAVAGGSGQLIVTRMLQGAGGALLTPGSLAILEASFAVEDRSEAIGAWSGLGGVATAAGPLLGGVLLAAASWRWIFVINVPLGAVVLWVSARHVPESRDPQATGRIDVAGAVLATVALGGVAYGLIEGPSRGWSSPGVVASLLAGAAAGLVFGLAERRASSPMLPLGLFTGRQFAVTNGVTFVVYAGLGGVLFLLPSVLQIADGYSALASGVALLPITVVMLALSARSGRLATAIGPHLQMSVGPVAVGAGLGLLALAPHGSYLVDVLPGVLVLALGLATTVAPLTATALNSVSERHAGVASAVNNDVARVGSLIAVAVLPALGGISGDSYLDPTALAHGFQRVVLIAGAWCVAGGILAAVGIRNPPRPATPSPTTGEPRRHCGLEATPLAGPVDPARPPAGSPPVQG
jgi:EmrB/QacA subfamily drug resistance transporter